MWCWRVSVRLWSLCDNPLQAWDDTDTLAPVGGRIAESGTYRELVRRPDSRFRALMAAQLDAVDGRRTKEEVEHMAGEEEDEGLGEDETRLGEEEGKEVVVEEQRR